MEITQPRVARDELPWETGRKPPPTLKELELGRRTAWWYRRDAPQGSLTRDKDLAFDRFFEDCATANDRPF